MTLTGKEPQKVPTGVFGPIKINGKACGCLLIGRSSASMAGICVIPGLIDADYTGEIQIMVQTLFPPLVIPSQSKIARLIPLPHLAAGLQPYNRQVRGDGGFGSSTAPLTFFTVAMDKRPQIEVTIEHQGESIKLTALLDSGADVSVISRRCWPSSWPVTTATASLSGVGGVKVAETSPPLRVTCDGKTMTVVCSLLPLPVPVQMLVGRDILSQLGAVLTIKNGQ